MSTIAHTDHELEDDPFGSIEPVDLPPTPPPTPPPAPARVPAQRVEVPDEVPADGNTWNVAGKGNRGRVFYDERGFKRRTPASIMKDKTAELARRDRLLRKSAEAVRERIQRRLTNGEYNLLKQEIGDAEAGSKAVQEAIQYVAEQCAIISQPAE